MLKILLTVAAITLVVWALVRMLDTRQYSRGANAGTPPPRRVTGPDDDADFLRDLERRRRADESRRKPSDQDETPETPDTG